MADALSLLQRNLTAIPKPPASPLGLLYPGNINIYNRPIVQNPDGSSSTVRSMSYGDDSGEHLVPTVSDGADGKPPHVMSTKEAMRYAAKTGQTLGTFDTPDHATAFAQALHEQQAKLGAFGGRTALPQLITPDVRQALQGPQAPAIPAPMMAMNAPVSLPIPAAPLVTQAPHIPSPLEVAQKRVDDLHQQGSGIDQIHNPLLRGLARTADIVGSVFAPTRALEMAIPGTTLHHQVLVNQAERNLANDQATQKAADESSKAQADVTESGARSNFDVANAAHLNAETPEVGPNAASLRTVQAATARHLNDEANTLENPKPAVEIHDTPMGLMAIDKQAGTATPVTAHGTAIGPKLETSVVQGIIGQDGKPHSYIVDKNGTKVADLGVHYERPVTVNVGQDRQAKNDVLKAYQPTLDSAERMNVMTESYEKAIKDHDQQAMLNLLANHLGMTMGLQKGARITKDLYQEAAHSTPWLAKIGAQFDKDGYLAGVTLNPGQMRQMVDLAQNRYEEDAKKSRSTAQYLGAPDDGPRRIPGAATIRFYLGKAGGDPQKAKQLAAADGWSVQ